MLRILFASLIDVLERLLHPFTFALHPRVIWTIGGLTGLDHMSKLTAAPIHYERPPANECLLLTKPRSKLTLFDPNDHLSAASSK
jgi:hypothetical protein